MEARQNYGIATLFICFSKAITHEIWGVVFCKILPYCWHYERQLCVTKHIQENGGGALIDLT